MQSCSPKKLYLLAMLPQLLNYSEGYVLSTFDNLSIHGEWYYPGYDLITLIRIIRTRKPHHGIDNPWVYMSEINRVKSLSTKRYIQSRA